MARYIDADALGIGKANRTVFDDPKYADGWNSAIDIIESAPTADVVKVRHGRWVMTENPNFSPFDRSPGRISNCSECGYQVEQYDYKFCPKCGAKMDLKED